jgi:sugar-specific transcriptional regulator TrmB
MAKFLRTSGISHKIEDIIIEAQEELVIVSPYLKISNNLFERLKEKSEVGVRVDFVYGKSELSHSEKQKIISLNTINLYFHENLHAKCYYNEQEMIITSMNLYEFSEKNNREMGVLIIKKEDEQLYVDGVIETKSIIAASKVIAQNTKDMTDSNTAIFYRTVIKSNSQAFDV